MVFCFGSPSKLKQFTGSPCTLASHTETVTDEMIGCLGLAPKQSWKGDAGKAWFMDEIRLARSWVLVEVEWWVQRGLFWVYFTILSTFLYFEHFYNKKVKEKNWRGNKECVKTYICGSQPGAGGTLHSWGLAPGLGIFQKFPRGILMLITTELEVLYGRNKGRLEGKFHIPGWENTITTNFSKLIYTIKFLLKNCGASLVAQWLRVCLPMQGTRVRALVWEDPTCHGATGPVSHSYWACASGACAPQQERPW